MLGLCLVEGKQTKTETKTCTHFEEEHGTDESSTCNEQIMIPVSAAKHKKCHTSWTALYYRASSYLSVMPPFSPLSQTDVIHTADPNGD